LKICMHKILQGDPFSEITLFLKGYNLSIPRFQPNDMLFFIAVIVCYAWKTEAEDILNFHSL
jgi:hypothetical protein